MAWTKEGDTTTSYGSGQRGYVLATLDGRALTTLDGRYLTREGIVSGFEEEPDSSDRYIPFGVGLKIADEEFNWILTEDREVYVVHSRTDFIEVEDILTNYIKE